VHLNEALGSDEWGKYWAGFDEATGREATVLVLRADWQRSKRVVAALRAGIQRMEGIRHGGVSAFRQMMTVGSQTYLLADAAKGRPLEEWAAERRSWEDVAPVAAELAAILDWAHGRGVVHGHLKPSNVLVEGGHVTAVLGFGADPAALRLSAGPGGEGAEWGAYRAPELAGGKEAPDDASDQYSMAAVLWRALCGETGWTVAGRKGFSGDAPEAAGRALERALSERPRQRFASCGDLATAMGGGTVTRKRGPGAAERRKRKALLALAGAVAGGLVAAAGLAWGGMKAVEAAQKTRKERREGAAPAPAPKAEPAAPAEGSGAVRRLAGTPVEAEAGKDWATPDGIEFIWIDALGCWVGRFEITNGDYRLMDPAHDSGNYKGADLNGERQPAVRLNFAEMSTYAAWLTERERAAGRIPDGTRFRLPTRAESVACAQAGLAQEFPWGGAFPPPGGAGNYADAAFHEAFPAEPWLEGYRDGHAASAPVEKSGCNAWGLFGMGGNVWETTAADAEGGKFGGWHGGAFDDFQRERMTGKSFYGYMGTARGAVNGFRLVLEAPQP